MEKLIGLFTPRLAALLWPTCAAFSSPIGKRSQSFSCIVPSILHKSNVHWPMHHLSKPWCEKAVSYFSLACAECLAVRSLRGNSFDRLSLHTKLTVGNRYYRYLQQMHPFALPETAACCPPVLSRGILLRTPDFENISQVFANLPRYPGDHSQICEQRFSVKIIPTNSVSSTWVSQNDKHSSHSEDFCWFIRVTCR